MNIAEVAAYFNEILRLKNFADDMSNNGLQLCGDAAKPCCKIAFAVDAVQASIDQAAAQGADLLVVHHGMSWGGEPRRWNGITGKRMSRLFSSNTALYAVHLPLDAHEVYGNNAVLCDLMQLEEREKFCAYHGMYIGFIGKRQPTSVEDVARMAANGKAYEIYSSPTAPSVVSKIAVVSGGGGMDALDAAIADGADVLVTGEFGHSMYHAVQEQGIHVVALGHYNSEVHGVKSLQRLAEEELKMQTVFLDIPTGL